MGRIAVVGAGMGALAVAGRVAVAGHRVTVHERGSTYGGAVGWVGEDGFGFDTGPGVLLLPAVYRDLFVKTGREGLEARVGLGQVDPGSRHVFADGTEVELPNASRSGVIAALDRAFGPGSGERWSEVMVRARQVWEATRRPLLEEVAGDPAALAGDPYPAARRGRGLFRRGAPTLATVAATELGDPRAVALLESYAVGYGLDPRSAPGSAAVLPYVEQTFGVWYVRGGMRALAAAVYERCLERKVEFRFGTAVSGLLEKDGRAAGVELADGSRSEADMVVVGAPLPALLGGPDRKDRDLGRRDEPGRFTVHLALRGPRPDGIAHRTLVHPADREGALDWTFAAGGADELTAPVRPMDAASADPRIGVTVLRPDDPATRPDDGHEAVTLVTTVPRHVAGGAAGAVDWTAPGVAEGFAERLVAVAEAAVPGLRERELWRRVRTPADTERETGAPGGSVPAPALAGAGGSLLRIGNRSPVPGLYVVGGWAHPGGGLPHAGMSGAIVADLIAGGPGGSR